MATKPKAKIQPKPAPKVVLADNSDIAAYEREAYEDRRRAVASLIPAGATVLDLGAGSGRLGKLLGGGRYIPVDHKQRTPETVVFDLDGPWPALPAKPTVVTVIGVLEYLHDPAKLLQRVARSGASKFIATYNDRRGDGNVNWPWHMSQDQLLRAADAAGMILRSKSQFGSAQTIYEWEIA